MTTENKDNVSAGVSENTAQDIKPNELRKTGKGRKRKKKIKKIIFIGILVVIAVLFVLSRLGIIGNQRKMSATDVFSVYKVSRRDIQQILTGTGTLQPQDSYNVTALASGEIVEDLFEEGDEVAEDQLLFKIDSSNLQSSLKRAQNAYKNAKQALDDLYEEREKLKIVSDYAGRIQNLNIEEGDEINAGTLAATILDSDKMLIDVPFMQEDTFNISKGDTAVLYIADTYEEISGTVEKVGAGFDVNSNGVKTTDVTIAVNNPGAITENTSATAKIGEYTCTGEAKFRYNVNKTVKAETSGKVASLLKSKGDYVNRGDVIAILESENLEKSIEKAQRSLEEAGDSLGDAKDAFDNYEIKAPISGTVIKKNYKKGEKIGSGNSSVGNVAAVIYDLSALKFVMNIDELDIDYIKLGQEVNVTSDAKSNEKYLGYVTKISVEGTTQNGTTVYPVTVTLENYGTDEEGNKLKPGMNIDAEIVLEKSENILAVPLSCVGRGNKVKVVSARTVSANADNPADTQDHINMQGGAQTPGLPGTPEAGGYSTVPNTVEYTEVTVETGISDNDFVEIISGLNEGDTVIVGSTSNNDWLNAIYAMRPGGEMSDGGMNGGGQPGGGMYVR